MTERKFKVGDRVVGTEHHYPHRLGKLGTVCPSENGGLWVTWDDRGTSHFVLEEEITHYGQTLKDLNVKPGDVVSPTEVFCAPITVGKEYTIVRNNAFENDIGNIAWPIKSKFRIISRAADEWTLCPTDYVEETGHECTYHMGVPVAYRVVEVPLVDVERRVHLEMDENMGCMFYHDPNATLRGQTRNGKPVGQWVIDMDVVE